MEPRLKNHFRKAPALLEAMTAFEQSIAASGLDPVLLELVRLRASQINGCAFCIHMHTTDLRKRGESEMRLYMLTAWRESSLYTARERAALAWTEALTRVAETQAPDADYDLFASEFTPEEQVKLSFAIGAINVWNRMQVGFRAAHPVENARDAA